MKDLYFAHDYNAQSDELVVKLIKEKGWSAYGIYWALIEKLHQSNDGWMNIDFECIAYSLRVEKEEIKKIIKDYDLFIVKKKKFSSKRVLANLEYRQNKSDSAKKSAQTRWKSKVREGEVKIPTIKEIEAYCKERKNNIDAEAFFHFYDSKGWMVGKNKMVKWKSAIITWEKKNKESKVSTKSYNEL